MPLALPVPRVSLGLQSSETTERADTVTQTATRIIRLLDISVIATECLKSEIVYKCFRAGTMGWTVRFLRSFIYCNLHVIINSLNRILKDLWTDTVVQTAHRFLLSILCTQNFLDAARLILFQDDNPLCGIRSHFLSISSCSWAALSGNTETGTEAQQAATGCTLLAGSGESHEPEPEPGCLPELSTGVRPATARPHLEFAIHASISLMTFPDTS